MAITEKAIDDYFERFIDPFLGRANKDKPVMNEYTDGKYYLAYGGYITFPIDTLEAAMLRTADLIGRWHNIELRQYVGDNHSRTIALIQSKARRKKHKPKLLKQPVFIPEWEPEVIDEVS